MTESLNHKSNNNDVDQTAHLFYRFIVAVCIAIKGISQYHFVFKSFHGKTHGKTFKFRFFSISF